ncbi:MAG: pyruvate dehydrogenase complex dihydrolipoamide acetyltransferase [Alphaproteobacteria bacterium]|nr:pyruvate dehydrogenase complex dihydrolipoamide acetyltransferase [Alphaproteobacteria bacterium]
MPKSITMPALSPTMTEGTVAKWLVKVGDKIRAGDVIAEVETDKATMEVEAVDDGTLGRIAVAEGTEGVAVNSVIAYLLEDGEDAAALGAAAPAAKPAAKPAPVATTPAAPSVRPTASATPPAGAMPAASGGNERVIASPLAKRMAAQAGLSLQGLAGSGPKGRIVKSDIDAALSGGRPAAIATTPTAAAIRPAAPVQPGAAYIEVPTTNMRRVIARRLTEAKQHVPHFYLTIDCEIDRLSKLREELNGRGEKEGYKLSVNDFVIRASALALKKVPAANASWTDRAILQYTSVDISIAVALDAGLITPIIRNADHKGLAQISNEMRELAKRARDGKLMPEEYQGGTFSISNLGMYGIKQFDAVINPPQGAILAVGAGEQRPVVKQGALAVATVMTCTLSCDHRVVDGALGARLLGAIKGYLEDPMTMLL